jgi:hypothetical protein
MPGSAGGTSFRSGKSAQEIRAAYDGDEATEYADMHRLKRRMGGVPVAASSGMPAAAFSTLPATPERTSPTSQTRLG